MKKYQSIFLMMFFMFSTLFTTVAYAGLSQRLAITGEAEFRVPADIRVTGISIGQTNGNVYNYTPKYSKETITMGFNLAASSSITYNVTVRNSGDIDQTIYDVSTVSTNNQGVTCSLTGYNKKDVIGYRDSVTFGVTCTSASTAENVNIVLQFDFRKVYYVSYDANSGTNAPSAQIKYENEDLEITSDEPTKEGYAFLGWSDSSSATTAQYEPGDTYTLNSDKLLYAVWQLSSYTVTYDKTTNGGTGPNEEETITYNESIDLTKTASKTGWTFVGWNTNKNAQTALSSLTMGGQPVTLYAIYSKTLTGTFNYYNEESTTVSTTIYNAETSGTITAPGALGGDTTYTFNGWSESNSANPGNNKVGASASITISSNTDYYASYTYTVTGTYYYYNGSVFTSDSATATAYMGYNGSKTGGTPTAPTVSTPSTWTNRGWSTGTAANSDTVTPGAITTDTTYYYTFSRIAVATVCVYDSSCTAKTGVTAYRSSYNNGNTYINASINLGTTSLSGYTFLGWKKDDTTVGSTVDVAANGNASIHDNTIYYARYSNTVTITYQANGGTTPSTTSSNTTTTAYMNYTGTKAAGTVTMPAATSRTGYTFKGWGTSKYAAGSTQSFTSSQTLAAQFTANPYTVTFKYNDGATADTTKSVTYDSAYGTLPSPSRTGYTFAGWYLANDILPSTYQQVAYITGSGTSYIDTGLTLETNFDIHVGFINNQTTSGEQPIVSTWTSTYNYWNLFLNSSNQSSLYIKGHNYASLKSMGDINNVTISRNNNDFTYIVNGTSKTITNTSLTSNPTTLKILKRGDLEHSSYASISKVIVYKDGVLKLNLIPCYRKSDNKPGLYDTINNTFYTNNATSGSDFGIGPKVLPSEYQQVEYIESTGTQYIDTGYYWQHENVEINFDGRVISNSSSQSLFGNEEYTTSSGNTGNNAGIPYGSNGSYSIYIGNNSQGTVNTTLGKRFKLRIKTDSNKNLTVFKDGSQVINKTYGGTVLTKQNAYISSNSSTTVGDIFIFANHNSSRGSSNDPTQNIGGMELYNFQLIDNGVLVRNFIPCYRKSDNKPGLYDTVTNTFYTNKASGDDFNIGNNTDNYSAEIESTTNVTIPQNHTASAKWTKNKYAVTYDVTTNGGSGTNDVVSYDYASTINPSTEKTASKSGWTFVGWNTDKNATAGLSSYQIPASTTVLYAIYSKTITGTFRYYNNQSTQKSVTIYNNASSGTITAPAALGAADNYSFRHWSTSDAANASSTVAASGSITISSDATYYASYSKTITGTFYYSTLGTGDYTYSNATASSKTTTATQYRGYTGSITNTNFTVPTEVTSSHGGASAENYAGVATAENSASVVTATTANTTFYAVYTESLTFYYYNGSSHTSKQVTRRMLCSSGKYSNSLSENAPTPSSYDSGTYDHWSYDSTQYSSSYARAPLETGTNALYSVYTRSITGTFNYHDGSKATSTTASSTRYYVSKSGGVNTYNTNISVPSAVSTNRTISSVVYTYRGVSTSNAANATVATPTTANTTYYASYSYTPVATFVYYNGSAYTSSTANGGAFMKYDGTKLAGTAPTTPAVGSSSTVRTPSGWTNRGWSTGTAGDSGTTTPGAITSNTTYYYTYSKSVKATVCVHNNSCSDKTAANAYLTSYNSGTVKNASIGLGTTSLSGYTFRGWSTSNAANATISVAANGNASINANTTYYASYTYTVTGTFVYYNGSAYTSTANTASAFMGYTGSKTGAAPTTPSVGTPSGWTNRGWSTGTAGDSGTTTPGAITGNATYYYTYSKSVKATVCVHNNSCSDKTAANAYLTSYNSGTVKNASIGLGTTSLSGYTFRGWSTSNAANATISVSANGSASISANTTYYASYYDSPTATFYYWDGSAQKSATASATRYMNYKGSYAHSNYSVPSAVSTNRAKDSITYTYRGVSTNSGASASVATPTTANTTYYASYSKAITATFYYWDGSAQKSATADATRYMNSAGTYGHSNYSVPSAVSTNRAKDSITYTYRGVSTNSGASASVATPTTANTKFYASYSASITATFYYFDGSKQASTTASATRYMNSSGEYTQSDYSVPSAVSTNRTKDGVTYAYRGVSTTTEGNATVATPRTYEVKFYASYSASITATFYYYSGSAQTSTTASATRYMNSSGTYTHSNYSVPSAVSTARTKDSISYSYRGVSTSNAANASVATPTTANTTFYASYSASITITFYYYNGSAQASTTSSGTRYMNSSGSYVNSNLSAIPSDVTQNRKKDNITYSCRGISTSSAANASVTTASTANTTYYSSYSASITATFYYSKAAAGTKASTTASATRYMNSSGSYIHSNYSVPTLTGDTAPTGTATLGWQSGPSTIGSITPTTASTTWYKTYKNAIKINYKNTSNTATSSSTALYRNAYYGTATNYTTVTSTSVDGTSQSTGSPSLSSLRGSFLGLTTSSTGTSYYGINNSSNVVKSSLTEYWAASYYKGSFLLGNNIYSIGSTSQTCNLYYSNTTGTCTVSPPTITVKANYVATGWSRSEGNSSSTSSVSPSSVSGTTYSFTANSITLYGHTSYASTAVAAKASNNVNNVTTYYTTLQAALNASTGGTTTLLADTSENITVASGTNKTLSLNGKTLNGSFANSGTITINGSGTIKNGGRVITNNGTMTINNATVSCTVNEFALVSNTSSSTKVIGSTLSNANTGTTSTIGQIGSGQLEFYNSTITGYGIWNSGSGNIYIYKSTANIQHIGNKIYQVSQMNTNTFEWAVWGTAITQCPTWTSNNGQDDLVWHQAASYTSSTTGTYKYCQIPKSEHKNETGAYVTHFYNGNTYVEGFAWTWQ